MSEGWSEICVDTYVASLDSDRVPESGLGAYSVWFQCYEDGKNGDRSNMVMTVVTYGQQLGVKNTYPPLLI